MDKKLIQDLYKEYNSKRDSILDQYGEKDGFIVEGKLWWNYYKELIDDNLKKIKNGSFSKEDAIAFYKIFGFGPKLYGRSFIENGIKKVNDLFLFLVDSSIPPNKKIREIVEEPESEHFFRGVGINFITLFLTTYFPNKYMQWNIQIDGALKILGLFPKRERGEGKSEFYLKINEACRNIGEMVNVKTLPIIDNFLYCLNKGYIGSDKKIAIEVKEEVIKEEVEEKETSIHTQMMYYLIKIGIAKNYDVWVAINDRNKSFNGENFNKLCLGEIPKFTQPLTLEIAKYIDVIWFKKRTANPVRFFEIEHTTSIYSGLLRLNDVKIDFPISKATIVIPKDRIDKVEKEIDRRTFKHTELSDICDYLTYEDLKKWYKAVDVDAKYS